MQKLIYTRQGAVAYAIAPLFILLFLAALLLFGTGSPFSGPGFLLDWPVVFILMALMSFALGAVAVLGRWCVSRWLGAHTSGGLRVMYTVLGIFLMWIPAVIVCLPMYVMNLIALVRGRYPQGQPIRWQPVLLVAALIFGYAGVSGMMERQRRSQPMPSAAEAYHLYAPDAEILAELPLGEDSVLIISQSGSGEFARTADGWTLSVPYANHTSVLPESAASLTICRNPADGQDVVILSTMGHSGRPAPEPCDSAGSAFTEIVESVGFATYYTWYALTDADAPGYTVTFE